MALSRHAIRCILCHGAVSIRAGNLDKIRLHMEVDHDCFFEQDLLIALNFLEEFERQEIIERVLPRMKVIFENVKKYSGGDSENASTYLNKRLFEDSDANEIPKKVKLMDADSINNNAECSKEEVDSNALCLDLEISSDDDDDDNQEIQKRLEIVTDEDGEAGAELSPQPSIILDEHDQAVNKEIKTSRIFKPVLKAQSKAIANGSSLKFGENDANCTEFNVPEANHLEEVEAKALASIGINVTSATQLTDALPNELQKPVNNEADYIACEFCSRRYKKSSINKHRARCNKRHSGDGHSTNPELFPSNLKVGSPKASANGSPKAAEINVISNNHSGSSPKFKIAKCHLCDKTMLKNNLTRHLKVMHSNHQLGETKVKIKCKLCNAVTDDEDELRKHISEVHSLDFDDVGMMVNGDAQSASQGSLQLEAVQPVIVKSMTIPGPYKAKVYGHKKANVRNEKGRLQCPYCPKDFTMKSARCRHVKQCHSDLRDAEKAKKINKQEVN